MENEKKWQLTKKAYQLKVRFTAPIYNAILRLLETGGYLNISECTNDLLKQYFMKEGINLETITSNQKEENEEPPSEDVVLDTVVVNARLTIQMKDNIDQVLDTGLYFNISHYLREVIRKDLISRGVLTT